MKFYKPTYFASAIVFLGVIIFFSIIWSTTTILPYSTANMHPYREGLDMIDNLPLEGSHDSSESTETSTSASTSAETPTDATAKNGNTKSTASSIVGTPSAPPSDSTLQKLMSNIYQTPIADNSKKEGMLSGISKDLLNPASPNDETSYFSLVGDSGVSVSLGSNYGSESDYVIDRFSQVSQSGKSCDPTSSGLTNSKGPLCLSNDLIQLLQTRGGNS